MDDQEKSWREDIERQRAHRFYTDDGLTIGGPLTHEIPESAYDELLSVVQARGWMPQWHDVFPLDVKYAPIGYLYVQKHSPSGACFLAARHFIVYSREKHAISKMFEEGIKRRAAVLPGSDRNL